MSRIIRITESDITNIVKKVLNESNSLLKEQWVRGNDPIGYWKILFNTLKTGGIGVKWEVVNNPLKSTFMYWGSWVIWKDVNKNGGYPVSFTNMKTKVITTFKFKGGKYAGQPLNNIILNPKSINATFNLGQLGQLSNTVISDTITKYKKVGSSTPNYANQDFESDLKKRMQAGSKSATINATKCPTNYKPVSSQEIASYKNSIKIPPWRDTRSLHNNYITLKNGTVCQIILTTWDSETSGNNKINFNALVNVLFDARNSSWNDSINKRLFNKKSSIKDFALAIISWAKKNKNYNPILLKTAISTIFRESKAESAMLFLSPKEVLGMLHNIFGGDRSQGYAQIKPTTAKEYGIDMNSLYTLLGSLDAIYKMLSKNYQTAKKYYLGPTVTIYKDNKLTKTPSIGGNAALHMAIASHNVGTGILGNWCETNLPNIANKCSVNLRVPNDSKPKEIATTNKNKKIDNYYPNIGGVHKYTPQFKKSFDQLASVPSLVDNIISGHG
jgi:hypothetical protein